MGKGNRKMKCLIIQPHSDDALFSVGHLLLSTQDVSVLTVENNHKRIAEDEKLYAFLGKNWHHLNVDFDDQSFYGFHKTYKSLNNVNAIEYLNEYFGVDKLEEIKLEVIKFVSKFIKKNKVTIYVPWGVGHPFHLFIRDVVYNEFAKNTEIRYYRDFPHSYKRRAKQQVEEQLLEYKLFKKYPVEEFADIKWDLARKFYKSQSGLLWFEQGYIKKNLPEEVYVRK